MRSCGLCNVTINILRSVICFALTLALVSLSLKPQYNEPLYNEFLDITNDFRYSNNSKIYEKEPQ